LDINRYKHFKEIEAPAPLVMPEIGELKHILDYLMELDICFVGAVGGLQPLSFKDVKDWADATCTAINLFEMQSLVKLSRTYASKHSQFDRTNAEDPAVVIKPVDRKELSDNLKSALRSMKVNYE